MSTPIIIGIVCLIVLVVLVIASSGRTIEQEKPRQSPLFPINQQDEVKKKLNKLDKGGRFIYNGSPAIKTGDNTWAYEVSPDIDLPFDNGYFNFLMFNEAFNGHYNTYSIDDALSPLTAEEITNSESVQLTPEEPNQPSYEPPVEYSPAITPEEPNQPSYDPPASNDSYDSSPSYDSGSTSDYSSSADSGGSYDSGSSYDSGGSFDSGGGGGDSF